MRKRSRIIFAMMVTACLVGIFWVVLWHAEPEPVYQGKPLSRWLESYVATGTNQPTYQSRMQRLKDRSMADEALHSAGTNAFPTLLRMLRADDPPLKVKLMLLAGRQHFISIHYVPDETRNEMALAGFRTLGDEAKGAVPSIVASYRESMADNSKIVAIKSLGAIHESPEQCVPLLIKAMHDPSSPVRFWAVFTIGSFGRFAKTAGPTVTGLLQDQDRSVRSVATNALMQIDLEAAIKARVFQQTFMVLP
jgi:hypothetical protein